jgi:4-amino-4-deoxy-L-arabinose transferase-like glycosyltransferase
MKFAIYYQQPKLVEISPVFWILLLGFFLRLGLMLSAIDNLQRAYAPDTQSYMDFAFAIINGSGWEYPSSIRTPVYPFFLLMFLTVFGEKPLTMMIFGQILVSTVNIWLTYLLSRKLLGDRQVALLAAVFMALNAESITHSFYLLTETLFTFLYLLATIFFLYGLSRHSDAEEKTITRMVFIFLAGVFSGLAILTRPFVLYYFFVVVVFLWFFDKENRVKKMIIFAIALLLFIAPWIVRNKMVVGVSSISTISSHNLYFYNALSYDASQTGIPEAALHTIYEERLVNALAADGLAVTEANQARVSASLAFGIIGSNPVGYAINHLKYDINSLLPDTDIIEIMGLNLGQKGTLVILKQDGLVAAIQHYFGSSTWMIALLLPSILLLGITYFGWGVATLRLLLEKQFFPMIVLYLPILYGLLLPGSPSNPRFRVPVMPFICILAAFGVSYLFVYYREKRKESQMPSKRTIIIP